MNNFEFIQSIYDRIRPEFRGRVRLLIRYCPNNCDLVEGSVCSGLDRGILHWHPALMGWPLFSREEAEAAILRTVAHYAARGDTLSIYDFKIYPSAFSASAVLEDQEEFDRLAAKRATAVR